MIQPQWPGLGPILPFLSLGRAPGGAGSAGSAPPAASDGVSASWWRGTTVPPFGPSPGTDPSASMWSVVQTILGLVGQLVSAFLSGANGGYGNPPATPQPGTTLPGGGPQQRFAEVDISSMGDPHLAETGTRRTAGGTQAVDEHFDSMTAHDDLVSSRAIEGGYRVSTAVTQPGANGVTWNDSATVHTNFDNDQVTMHRDGSFSVTDAGQTVALAKGQTVTLSGGETVGENADGSLVVSASNEGGGTIATTLRATGGGVDVTTHAHELPLGGDVVAHGRRHHHGAPHPQPPLAPVADPIAAPTGTGAAAR